MHAVLFQAGQALSYSNHWIRCKRFLAEKSAGCNLFLRVCSSQTFHVGCCPQALWGEPYVTKCYCSPVRSFFVLLVQSIRLCLSLCVGHGLFKGLLTAMVSKPGWCCALNLSATKTHTLLCSLGIRRDGWDMCSRRYTSISASFCCHSVPIFRQDSLGTQPWCGTMASCSLSWKRDSPFSCGCAPVLCAASARTRLVGPWNMRFLRTRRLIQEVVRCWDLRTGAPQLQHCTRYECGSCLALFLLAGLLA